MPFKKIDAKKELKRAIKESPELKELIEKADKEYQDIKAGKLNKKFDQ
jgi:cell fate (sporulation/competence/biofilm development) regulator YlbF (YheA/YmcA/DUF963 family)